jgi:hypothetical protein
VRSRLALGAAMVVCAGGCGSAPAAVPDRFSGTWKLPDERTILIRHVDRAEGERILRALGGEPCGGDAIYFRATYFGGNAHLAGCSTADGRRLVGRFNDNGRRGMIEQRLLGDHPPTFEARLAGVGGKPFRVTATRIGP